MGILFFSSLIFITNVLSAIFKENYLYAGLFFLLTVTSLIVHSNHTLYTNLIDKLAIGLVVLFGGYTFYNKLHASNPIISSLIILTFITTIFLYMFGYCTASFCFHEDIYVGNLYHVLLHFISSIGHHMIIFL